MLGISKYYDLIPLIEAQHIHSDLLSFGLDRLEKIPPERRSHFFNWFQKKAEEFELSNELSLNVDLERLVPGQCHENAQAISVEYNVDYYEGFTKDKNGTYFFHGFNVVDGKVEDYSMLKSQVEFGYDRNKSFEKKYFGIKIEYSYIMEKHPNIKLGCINMGELLVSYFLEE
jgi:hypothetical protein